MKVSGVKALGSGAEFIPVNKNFPTDQIGSGIISSTLNEIYGSANFNAHLATFWTAPTQEQALVYINTLLKGFEPGDGNGGQPDFTDAVERLEEQAERRLMTCFKVIRKPFFRYPTKEEMQELATVGECEDRVYCDIGGHGRSTEDCAASVFQWYKEQLARIQQRYDRGEMNMSTGPGKKK
jgi:hypothetical protein